MTWNTTNLNAGPLANNSYDFTITGLSASTIYEYRAYFTVSGISYFGNILTGTTASISYSIPVVKTGYGSAPTTTGFTVINNVINDKGNAPILEYGILYTQTPIWGTESNLKYEQYPVNVKKVSIFSDVPSIPHVFNMIATNLQANTNTYFRTFAKNAIGIGYDSVKPYMTASPPIENVNINGSINWNAFVNQGLTDGFDGIVRLHCCNGTIVESKSYPLYSKYGLFSWSVQTGCYYVDFSGLNARYDGYSVSYDIFWTDSYGFGYNNCTNCFSGDNVITAEIPTIPMV